MGAPAAIFHAWLYTAVITSIYTTWIDVIFLNLDKGMRKIYLRILNKSFNPKFHGVYQDGKLSNIGRSEHVPKCCDINTKDGDNGPCVNYVENEK